MKSKKDSSTLYPSADGSNVHRGSDVWSLPTLVSSPAYSMQSMATNVTSQLDKMSYKILVKYPAETYQYRVLDEFTEWLVETLYPKLLAVEEAWRDMEEMAAKLTDSNIQPQAINACIDAALYHVTSMMEAQCLFLDVVEYPQVGSRVKWTLSMYDVPVFQGVAESKNEVLCAAFFEKRRGVLKNTPYYPRSG